MLNRKQIYNEYFKKHKDFIIYVEFGDYRFTKADKDLWSVDCCGVITLKGTIECINLLECVCKHAKYVNICVIDDEEW